MKASRRQSVDKKLLSLLPIVLLYDQKYQKSSKRFPLRNLPVISRLAKVRSAPRLCQRTDFVHARHFFYAGVEPTHTRICSIRSCDVFARVVWIKP